MAKKKKAKDFTREFIEAFPRQRVTPMSDEQLEKFGEIKVKTMLSSQEADFLQALYYDTFNIANKKGLCRSCPTIWRGILQQLTTVYDIQKNENNQ